MSIETSTYELVSRELLRTLMQRTGDGQPITIRALAAAVPVRHHSSIGHLLTGEQKTVPEEVARAVADRIGVDLLVLWVPVGRSTRSVRRLTAVPA